MREVEMTKPSFDREHLRVGRGALVRVLLLCGACQRTTAISGDVTATTAPLAATTTVPATTPSSSASANPAPCGLPAALLDRGWPRRLDATSVSRPPTAGGLASKTAFTLGVIPDTQYYTLCRNAHFAAQSRWLAEHVSELGLRAAIHLGDITESNTPEEWMFAQTALAPLRAALPTFLATGNHDYGDGGTANRRHTLFANYFGDPPAPTRPTVAETLEPASVENAYYRVSLADVADQDDYLGVLVLEWSPRARAVEWADQVLTKYPHDRVVFVTHAYLYYDSTRYDWANKSKEQEWNPHAYGDDKPKDKQPADVFDGEKLWQSLISRHGNVFLTLNGHVLGDGAGLASSRTPKGNLVHQVLANYQMLEEGGLGYLRLLGFDRNGRTLRIQTYSPSLGQWATAADQNFELSLEPPLW